jgi:hypothetical protein
MNFQRKKLYLVDAWVPVSSQDYMWPINWKTIEGYEKKKFGLSHRHIPVPASSFDEANSRLEEELKRAFGDLPPAPHFGGFGDKFEDIDYNGKIKEKGKCGLVDRKYLTLGKSPIRSDIISIDEIGEPLYFLKGIEILGVLLSYKEVEQILNNKLPKLLILNNSLIPTHNNWPERYPPLAEREPFYYGEKLTPEKQKEIAINLLENEPPGRDSPRSRRSEYHAFEALVDREHNRYFFLEELIFFVFNPCGFFTDGHVDRFKPMSFTQYDHPESCFYFFPKNESIGTKEEIINKITKKTSLWINGHKRSISSLEKNLSKRLALAKSLPYFN